MVSNALRTSSTRAFVTSLSLIVGVGLTVNAAAGAPIHPKKTISSQNEFLDGGYPMNGSVLATNPVDLNNDHSGADMNGYISRAQRVDPGANLGSFTTPYLLGAARHGAGAVLARGPVQLLAPRDTNSYLYVIGGKGSGGVTATIERAEINANGVVYPGVVFPPLPSLTKPRYGAAVVARGDSIYVIGGYDENDDPLETIERLQIDPDGNMLLPELLQNPGWGGDVAAVVVNGYVYVIGGNDSSRGPSEVTRLDVARAEIETDGDLAVFESLEGDDAFLPVATAGGRAVVVAAWDQGAPVNYIYYMGGNVGSATNGATRNIYRLRINDDNSVQGPWVSIQTGSGIVSLNDPRELFAAVVTNGFVWVIGGETADLGTTTIYGTVERAEIFADGSIGAFGRLDSLGTFINGVSRATDINGVAFNNNIYVPGGRNLVGDAQRPIFQLSLANHLTNETAADTAIFSAVRGLGGVYEIDSFSFDIQPDTAQSGGILFRFRYVDSGTGSWSDWSGYVTVDALPSPSHAGGQFLLDLSYAPGREGCTNPQKANPTAFQGPLNTDQIEYEVLMPLGGKDQRFNGMTINDHPLLHFALPGGYDPRNGLVPPPSCSPSNAIAEGFSYGWVRLKGIGFENMVMPLIPDDFEFVSADPSAPDIFILDVGSTDSQTIELLIEVNDDPTYSVSYDLEFRNYMLLSPALLVHPRAYLTDAPAAGLDIVGNSTPNDNVVAAPASSTGSATFVVSVLGSNLRSGRVDETGAVAVDSLTATTYWPPNPYADPNDQPNFLRYMVEDLTDEDGGRYVDIKVVGTPGPVWKDVGPGELKSSMNFEIPLEINYKVKSGTHDLRIYIQSPQLGTSRYVTQTIHVVPALRVDRFTTHDDPTPDPPPISGNNYNWTGSYNPAMADLGDAVQIDVMGAGFMSDSGYPLVQTVTPQTSLYGPGVGTYMVTDRANFYFLATVPTNTYPGRHDFGIVWQYVLGGGSDPFDSNSQVPPVKDSSVVTSQTWLRSAGSWESLFIVPPRAAITSILGSSNTRNPVVLLQADPKLTINGNGFATGGPIPGFTSVLYSSRLISLSNSPNEDIRTTDLTMLSDRQARLTADIPSNQRPGEIYQLEIQTQINYLPASSGIRLPYSTGLSSELVAVIPLPICNSVVWNTPFFAVNQGGNLSQVEVIGENFDLNTRILLGPGVTVSNLVILSTSRMTFDVRADSNAPPGRRTVVIENGPTSALLQTTSCQSSYDLWVVPVLSISNIQPSIIPAPPASVGTRRVPVELHGANFVPGARVCTVTPATGVSVVSGSEVVVNSSQMDVELSVNHSAQAASYVLRVCEPAGPVGMPEVTDTINLDVSAFLEIGISAVAPQPSTQCQGRSGTLQVTGTNFEDSFGTDLIGNVSLGSDVSINSWTVNSRTSLTINYAVSEGAPTGNRSLRLDSILPGGTPAVYSNALTVTSSPSITSVSPGSISPGQTKAITIAGRNFLPGATLSVDPPTDVTLTPTSISSGQILATLTVGLNAAPGPRAIIVNNNDGACSVATLNAAISIADPPRVISGKYKDGSMLLDGSNFHPSLLVYIDGSSYAYKKVTSNRVTIKKAKNVFVKDIPVPVLLKNADDGGEVSITVTRRAKGIVEIAFVP